MQEPELLWGAFGAFSLHSSTCNLSIPNQVWGGPIYKKSSLTRERQKVLAELSITKTERNNGDILNHY